MNKKSKIILVMSLVAVIVSPMLVNGKDTISLSISSTSLNFTGKTNDTTNQTQVITLTNTGNSPIQIDSINLPEKNPSSNNGIIPNLYHLGWTGQSLSIGLNGTPVLSSTQPNGYNNFTLSGNTELGTTLAPLTATAWAKEAPAFAAGAEFTSMSGSTSPQIALTMHGVSGIAYDGIKRTPATPSGPITGTAPYKNGQTQINNVMSAVAGSYLYRYIGTAITHGEKDTTNGMSAAQYESDLVQMQKDYESDTNMTNLPLFVDQLAQGSQTKVAMGPAMGQWDAMRDNPDKIIIVTPKYATNGGMVYGSDGVHLTNVGYRHLGEMYGKALYKMVVMGERWVPLSPRTITRSGNIITMKAWVPSGNLTLDTTNFPQKAGYGFEYYNDQASGRPTISDVSVSGDTATITLSGTPSGFTTEHLRYGFTGTGSNISTNNARVGGNLRDSDDSVGTLTGDHLYDWMVQFDEPVGFNWSPYTTGAGFPGNAKFTQSNNCPNQLDPGQSCQVSVTFEPRALGHWISNLTINTSAGSPVVINLTGDVVGFPKVNMTPVKTTFASQVVGTVSLPKIVTIKNLGTGILPINSMSITGANMNDFNISSSTCSTTLAVGQDCTVSVVFKPTLAGTLTAAVTVNGDTASSANNVAITGTATVIPKISWTPQTLAFGYVTKLTSSPVKTFVVSNSGNADMTISSITLTGSYPTEFSQTNDCPATLAPLQSCTISAIFSPTSVGAKSALVTITDNVIGSPHKLTMTGSGK